MTEFNARADAALRAMKTEMGLPSTQVPDGGPPRAAPPPGSYAAQLQGQQQVAQEIGRNTVPVGPSDTGGAAPASQQQPEGEGSIGPDGRPVPFQQHPIYDRFAEVSRERTDFKRKLEEADAQRDKMARELEAIRAENARVTAEHQQFLQANLDQLSPEDRHRFLMRDEMNRMRQEIREEVRQDFAPAIRTLRAETRQREIERLAAKYGSYDASRHQDLIDAFQHVNPGCTVEMAFKAVAEPWELGLNGSPAHAGHTPPVVIPTPGGAPNKFMPSANDSEKEQHRLQEQAALVRQQAMSSDPAERAKAMDTATASIRDRTRGRMPF